MSKKNQRKKGPRYIPGTVGRIDLAKAPPQPKRKPLVEVAVGGLLPLLLRSSFAWRTGGKTREISGQTSASDASSEGPLAVLETRDPEPAKTEQTN